MNAAGIKIIGASAGSGKTHRLTEEVISAVDSGRLDRIPLEGLVAVTFTRKAHTELAARIRRTLVTRGRYDEAATLPLATIGTVHAACLRWLQEFALDAGLSPTVEVTAEEQEDLLRQALETALTPDARARLDHLATSFHLLWDARVKRYDWLGPVAQIMELARSNRIPPESLPAMAERSIAGLLALLPPPAADADALDRALTSELIGALSLADGFEDGTAKTREVIETMTAKKRLIERAELTWSDWIALSGLAPGRASDAIVEPLRAAARRVEEHPRLRAELRELTLALFGAARDGLTAYARWKTERRLVDYVDLLDRALGLMANAHVRAELSERLDLVVVDELQDSSPIQLALFLELHRLAGRSVWVGDEKQCIFEYAGADPQLMDAVAAWVERDGGDRDRLRTNHRSRPELVEACSALFAAAFERHAIPRGSVEVDAARAPVASTPPLGAWFLEAANKGEEVAAIAEGVRRLIDSGAEMPVIDRVTRSERSLRPGDIAVLVAKNETARSLASALHACGVRAAIARAGLLATPEGTLVDASLRWLLDGGDALAAAVVDALTGFGGDGPDRWLGRLLGKQVQDPAAGWRHALGRLRDALGVLSPSEALDQVLAALDVVGICARWPESCQRVANLDALRALASRYEERCRQEREAATIAGLLRYFDALRVERLRREEMLASDDQHVTLDEGTVVVCTYHKSKGLEWPVVVLADLDRPDRRDAFDVAAESDEEGFDPLNPLAGRWIRYWPWPFGSRRKAALTEAAARSPEGRRVADREEKERARLLYVGFTRARDHLVLAVRVGHGKPKTAWLDTLADDRGPLVSLPVDAGDGAAQTHIRTLDGELEVPTRVAWLGPGDSPAERGSEPDVWPWFARPRTIPEGRLPYRISPSALEVSVGGAHIGTVLRLPSRLVIDRGVHADDVVGDAVHAYFAADIDGLAPDLRLARAARVLTGFGLCDVAAPEALLRAGDSLRAFCSERWPDARWCRELPIDARIATAEGEQRISGVIDLLLDLGDGCVIIDHKTFPAPSELAWRKKCRDFIPQLAAYAGVMQACGKPVLGSWIHLPVGGGMVEIVLPASLAGAGDPG